MPQRILLAERVRPLSWAVFVCCAATACWNNPAKAKEIYVNNVSGNDVLEGTATTNTSPNEGPVQSIAKALRLAAAGDHIILANTGQPYQESISLVGSRHSGTAYQSFTLEGNGAVLDGTRPVPQDAWEWVRGDVFRFQPEEKQFQQLFLDGTPLVRQFASSDEPTSKTAVPPLEPKQWALVDGWIYFRVDSVTLPQSYALTYAGLPAGLTLYKVNNVVISNLTVQGYQLDGVYLHDATGPCSLVGLNCRWNGRCGVAVEGVSQIQLISCTLDSNGLHQLLLNGYSDADLRNCQLPSDAANNWQLGKNSKLFVDGQRVPPAGSK